MPQGEDLESAFSETTVEQRTGQKHESGNDGDPVQLGQRASHDIAGEMRVRQNARSKHSRRQNERKKDQTTDPGYEREQHDETKQGQHARIIVSERDGEAPSAEGTEEYAGNAKEARTGSLVAGNR